MIPKLSKSNNEKQVTGISNFPPLPNLRNLTIPEKSVKYATVLS